MGAGTPVAAFAHSWIAEDWCTSLQLRVGPDFAPRRDVAGHWLGQHTRAPLQLTDLVGEAQALPSLAVATWSLILVVGARWKAYGHGEVLQRCCLACVAGGKALQRRHLACLHVAGVFFFAVSSDSAVLADMAIVALGTGPSQTGAAVVAANTQNRMP